jgi:WD40 repeat protein
VDAQTGRELFLSEGAHGGSNEQVMLTASGSSAAAWIRLSGLGRTGKLIHTLVDHQNEVMSVAISHDGRQLFSGGSDATIRVWDAETGR